MSLPGTLMGGVSELCQLEFELGSSVFLVMVHNGRLLGPRQPRLGAQMEVQLAHCCVSFAFIHAAA